MKTPRTDSVAQTGRDGTFHYHVEYVEAEVARALEIELKIASEERDSAIDVLVSAKSAWMDRADPEKGPYVPFGEFDSLRRKITILEDSMRKITQVKLEDHGHDSFEAYGMRGDIARSALSAVNTNA